MAEELLVAPDGLRADGCIRISDIKDFSEKGIFFRMTLGRTLFYGMHRHEFYEIFYLISGSCTHSFNGKEHICHAGNVYFMRPEDIHYFTDQAENTNVVALSVTPDEMEKYLSLYRLDYDTVFKTNADSEIPMPFFMIPPEDRNRLDSLCEAAIISDENVSLSYSRVILSLIFSHFVESRYKPHSVMPEHFAHVLSEMNRLENASEGIEAFLRLSNFSHTQLCRLTKKYLGITPSEYVCSARLRHAYSLIMYSNLDYATICETVGFSSFSHFHSLIKKHYRKTPAQLRKSSGSEPRTV